MVLSWGKSGVALGLTLKNKGFPGTPLGECEGRAYSIRCPIFRLVLMFRLRDLIQCQGYWLIHGHQTHVHWVWVGMDQAWTIWNSDLIPCSVMLKPATVLSRLIEWFLSHFRSSGMSALMSFWESSIFVITNFCPSGDIKPPMKPIPSLSADSFILATTCIACKAFQGQVHQGLAN